MKHMPPAYCPQCGSGRDMEAREKLVLSNLRFVVKTAKKFTQNPDQIQRLSSAGNVGLIIALDKFNLSMHTKFLTYAAWWIRKEMLDEIHSSGLVHIPSHKQKSLRKEQKLGEYSCVHCGYRTKNPCSNDELSSVCVEDDHEFILVDSSDPAVSAVFPIDNLQISVDENLENQSISDNSSELLSEVLNRLPLRQRDRFIMLQYHNIPEEDRRTECKTLPQLAAITGITPERVRQIKVRIQNDVLKELNKIKVQSFSDICVEG